MVNLLQLSNTYYVMYAYEGLLNFYEVGIPEFSNIYAEYLAHLENEILQKQLLHYGKPMDSTAILPDAIIEQYQPMSTSQVVWFLKTTFVSFALVNETRKKVIVNNPVRKVW